jgi:hypothetical protein
MSPQCLDDSHFMSGFALTWSCANGEQNACLLLEPHGTNSSAIDNLELMISL